MRPNGFLATAATDVSTGDLPSGVNVIEEADCMNYGAPLLLPYSDEGRAMTQIVHDVAPGASLAFYTADNSEADFANGIGTLAAAGATVIADDVGYFDEPFFQDGLVAQAVNAAEAKGVAYFRLPAMTVMPPTRTPRPASRRCRAAAAPPAANTC